MLDIACFEGPERDSFADRFGVTYVTVSGNPLHGSDIVVLRGSERFDSDLAKHAPDVVFGLEQVANRDHMDYPKHAMRIQTARAIRRASCLYAFTPNVLADEKTLEVARFNAKVLAQAKVPVVFVSLAADVNGLAHPRDLDAIGSLLGFSDEAIARGRAMLESLPSVRYERDFSIEQPR